MTDTNENMVDQEIAEQAGVGMYARDTVSQNLGITLEAIGPGRAVMNLRVGKDMVNIYDVCHGGFIFTLADCCLAYASNSYNRVTVGRQCEITFVKPANLGDLLVATGREVHRNRRSGIYDVTVAGQAGETVALFRGHSRTMEGEVVPDLTIVT